MHPVAPLVLSLSVILAILIVASGQIRKNCPARSASAQLGAAQQRSRGGERSLICCSPLDTDRNLPRLNCDITTHFSFLTTIVRQVPHVNPAGSHIQPHRHLPLKPAWMAPGGHRGRDSTGNALRERTARRNRRSHQGRKPGTVIPVRKLASAEVPKGDRRRICVCHRRATCRVSDRGIVGPHGSGRSRGSSQWGAAELRPSRLR
jgi:hypothetical protein